MASRSLQRLGLPPHLLLRLQASSILTARDLFARNQFDLVEILDLPYETVSQILVEVAGRVLPPPVTALHLLKQAAGRPMHLRSSLQPLDEALYGGLSVGNITEVVGPAGLGKTQFCLMLSVVGCLDHAAEGGTVLYIDTERKFSSKRLSEIARSRFPSHFPSQDSVDAMLPRVLVLTPHSADDLQHRLASLESTIIDHGVRLVVIDSIAALARSDYGAASLVQRQAALSQQAARLKHLAETFQLPVVVSNQVTTLMQGGRGGRPAAGGGGVEGGGGLTAALGTLWAHAVNTRLVLESYRGTRFIRITKSPAAPTAAFPYAVTAAGLEVLEGVATPPELLVPDSVVDMAIAHEISYQQADEGTAMAE